MQIPVTFREDGGIDRSREVVEVGLPLPEGEVAGHARWVVVDEDGNALPSQFRTLVCHPDGSARAIHGVFLANVAARQRRSLVVTSEMAIEANDTLLSEENGTFRASSGGMEAAFADDGSLMQLDYHGTPLLDDAAGPSMILTVRTGPAAGGRVVGKEIQATVREAGPVRAVLNLCGTLFLRDRRGDLALKLDCDYVLFRDRPEIHVRPMLVGAVTDATVLTEWSLGLRLMNGGQLTYGREEPLVRLDPNHEYMSWRGLDEGWVSWKLTGDCALTAWSPDFARHQNGFVSTRVIDEERRRMSVVFARVEPYWGYQDVSNTPTPITVNRGGWRRWEASFRLHGPDLQPQDVVAPWRKPLRAFPSTEYYRSALRPWLEGTTRQTGLWKLVTDKCEEFVCSQPEYSGSLHGGWDGVNRTYIERGVSRGDFGEYLFHEFFRTGHERFHRMGSNFGQIYRDIFCFTIPEATQTPQELGGARRRHSEHQVCGVRSYRGAVLLAYMYQETGDVRYLEAIRQRAGYHLANYPHHFGRLSMGTRDSAFMARYLNRPELIEKAMENTLHSLDRHFDSEHGYFEEYDETEAQPDGRYGPRQIRNGFWFMHDFLATSNASPEMTAYNIIGWYGMRKLHDPGPQTMAKIRRVCDWFRDCQNEDGSWPYPHDTSTTRWGHGCLQDAMAMLYAHRLFGDQSYLSAARKSIRFAADCFAKYGRIPLLLGILPHEETEDSLTYYYGLETLALYNEAADTTESKDRNSM